MSANTVVSLEKVCVVFGARPRRALAVMDSGGGREEARQQTGCVVGAYNCSLRAQEGEIVVLMGLSGSGKSSLLRTVNGLNPVARGAARVFNGEALADVARADAAALRDLRRRRVAMVFQQFALLPWRTVEENVAFGLEVAGVLPQERRARAAKQLQMVGLQDWGGRRVGELSGGMQQRVGLARAFATEAPILLMDEPFSALDPLIRVRLQDELLRLQRRMRRTILFVSHDLDEALKIGNRICIMEGGRVAQQGTPQDIVLNPATPYVADFVAHMNPLKTLRAGDIMRPPRAEDAAGASIDAQAPLTDALRAKRDGAARVWVTRAGDPVGIIGDHELYNALLGERA